jgi:gluconokinase
MIVMVAGVAGSGKTTVGTLLASRLGWKFADGDSFHPAANVAKMRAGVALTDADRGPWLGAIARWMDEQTAAGQSAVVACSALKRAYRQTLVDGRPDIRLVFLQVGRDAAAARLRARHGHFFPAALLDSQLADLEYPQPSEAVLTVSADAGSAVIAAEIIGGLHLHAQGLQGASGLAPDPAVPADLRGQRPRAASRRPPL